MGNPRSLEPASFGGSSLEQMHSWVHSGPGAAAMHSMSDLWVQEQQYMRDLANRVRDRMAQAKVVIESQSGDAMQNAVAPVVLWSEVTADNALTQSQRMQEQGEAFSKVQAAVPSPSEMKPVPSDNFLEKAWASMTGSKTDTQIAQQHNEQLRQEAVTAFNSYQGTSQSSVSGSPTFTAPPPATVDTSVSGGAGPGVGSFGSPGGGGSAGGSAGGGSVGSHGGGGQVGGAPGTSPNLSGSYAAPPTATHSAGVGPMPTPPSFQPSALGSGGAGGGMSGGFSGLLGGFGGGTAGGGAGGSGGRLGGTGSGGVAGKGAGRAGAGRSGSSAGRAGSLAAEEEAAAGRGSNSTSQSGAPGRGVGRKGEEDDEHYAPEFLKADHGFFDDELPRVAPAVFGE